MHLIDLGRWFLGDFTEVHGFAHTYFWDMPVDDNGFLLLRTAARPAWPSCTPVAPSGRTCSRCEIYGRAGKLEIDGLGGSYGVERLTFYRMLPEMGPPETTIWEYPARRSPGRSSSRTFWRTSASGRAARRPASRDAAGGAARRGRRLLADRAMIITRSPLRISLGGGGTDLPSYYREHGGFLIAAAIDKYVYITLHQTFAQELILKYSKLEHVHTVDEIQHPIIREALRLTGLCAPHLEITSMADIPAGTGPGLVRQLHHGAAARRCTPTTGT